MNLQKNTNLSAAATWIFDKRFRFPCFHCCFCFCSRLTYFLPHFYLLEFNNNNNYDTPLRVAKLFVIYLNYFLLKLLCFLLIKIFFVSSFFVNESAIKIFDLIFMYFLDNPLNLQMKIVFSLISVQINPKFLYVDKKTLTDFVAPPSQLSPIWKKSVPHN